MRRGVKPGDAESGAVSKYPATAYSVKLAPRNSIEACTAAITIGTNETRVAGLGCAKEACSETIVLQQSWPS